MYRILSIGLSLIFLISNLQATEEDGISHVIDILMRHRGNHLGHVSSSCNCCESHPCSNKCRGRRGHQGSNGPQGSIGPQGPFVTSYISAYNQGTQVFPNTTTDPQPILFSSILTASGINQAGSFFQVQNAGVYLIGWNLTATTHDASGTDFDILNITLHSLTTNTNIPPTPNAILTTTLPLVLLHAASGQTIVRLLAGEIIELTTALRDLGNNPAPYEIRNPTLYITQIAF